MDENIRKYLLGPQGRAAGVTPALVARGFDEVLEFLVERNAQHALQAILDMCDD